MNKECTVSKAFLSHNHDDLNVYDNDAKKMGNLGKRENIGQKKTVHFAF